MPNIYLNLLEEFEETGLSSKKSISPFIARNFKIPILSDYDTWNNQNKDAMSFLSDVIHTGHFEIDKLEIQFIGKGFVNNNYGWFDTVDINARITILGLEYLEKHQVNKRITDNATKQTLLLSFAGFFTACTLAISIFTFISDKSKEKLLSQSQLQTQQIHSLQIELSQVMNRQLDLLKAMKNRQNKNEKK